MHSAPSENDKIRALPWALAQGVLNTFFGFWTFGGSVFLLFLCQVGLPKQQIGALLAVFPFCGILALGFAPVAARWGWKRVFIAGYGIRKFVMALLLFLPWVMSWGGHTASLYWLVGVLVIFAVLRAIAETGFYPWSQEYIPNSVRGKFTGINIVLGTCASAVAVLIAGQVIGQGAPLSRYLALLAAGCFLGFLGVLCMIKVPGGAPRTTTAQPGAHRAEMVTALRDRNFLAYLGGMGGVTLGAGLLISFLPLYVKEQLGVRPGTVVTLDTAAMLGAALSSLFWGWAADRVGSRPVLIPALALNLLIPLGWLFLPHQTPYILVYCATLYFTYGVAANGIAISTGRLLFNSVVPTERSSAYTAIYYAWMGITGGVAPLLAGQLLSVHFRGQTAANLTLFDGYHLLFLLSLTLSALGWWRYSRVKPDGI